MKTVCLAILNFNGRKHLEHLLPTACAAAKEFPGDCSVLVLDNRSPDPDVQWIRQNFPSVLVEVAPENDFLFSYDWLAEKRGEDIIVFLNNDLRLHPEFLAPLVRHFGSPDVFSVSACSYDWEGKDFTSGPSRLEFRNGFYDWSSDFKRQELCHTFFTSGGFMAADRRKFLELGGFNRLFHPAYHEDVELCFRAWLRGWRCVYEPASVVWHRENASWNAGGSNRSNRLHVRNALLFQRAYLPLNGQNWRRRWSLAKLMLGGAMRFDFTWATEYWRAADRWRRFQKQSGSTNISVEELDLIRAKISRPVTN
jgi:GT2 family glycosyltransferase